jgi:Na+/H+ antiporter NhaC
MSIPAPLSRGRLALRLAVALAVAGLAWGALALAAPVTPPAPGPTSLIPAFLVIAVALALRAVLVALSTAVLAGAILAAGPDFLAALRDRIVGPALLNADNQLVIGFALALVAAVRLLTVTGALSALMRPFARLAGTRRGSQAAAGLMGGAVFFDDYANALVVGAAARPLTDAQRVSREKLAWIVDATAAPVAGLVPVSTWVAYEIKLLGDSGADFSAIAPDGFGLLIASLPFRFYCLFTLAFMAFVIATRRDYGPMLRAERRAFTTGRLTASPLPPPAPATATPDLRVARLGAPLASLAILIVVAGAICSAVGLFDNALLALMQSALASLALTIVGTLAGRLLPLRALGLELLKALGHILPLVAILALAFSLRHAADALGAGSYLATLAEDVPTGILPLACFLVAASIAFATGTSWGTMSILIPLALPLAAKLTAGHPDGPLLVMLVAASILDGAIFGDHCALISDTTIMSAVASDCPVVDHFDTQLPYTFPPMLAAGLCGYGLLGLAPATPWFAAFALGLLLCFGAIRVLGQRSDLPAPPAA